MAEPSAAGLALFVRTAPFVFAIDSAVVERMLLADEVDDTVRHPDGTTARIQVGGHWYATASLAALFGSPAPCPALVLLRLADDVRLGLQVGACLKVAPLPPLMAVPPRLVRTRGPGVRGAFETRELLAGAAVGPCGLAIDPWAILTRAERDQLAAELRAASLDEWDQL